ncbi:MAG: DUF2812 domain-containing protein [Ruminococcaceae bacterium]|nr:DUF2812 domain-containing protein [Oscillospiraceae bacterium]
MNKIIFFNLWEIEKLEQFLEDMECNGFRLDNIKYSYCFCFKKSEPRLMHYFLSYKSFRGQSMDYCDYALESKYSSNQIKSKMCFFSMYRTKVQKEELTLLYEVRMDYMKSKLLENALTVLFLAALLLIPLIAATHFGTLSCNGILIIGVFVAICVVLTVYYFYGYYKQKNKSRTGDQSGDGSLS